MSILVAGPWYANPTILAIALGGAALVGLYVYSKYTNYNLGQTLGSAIVSTAGVAVDTAKEVAKELYKQVDIGGGETFGSAQWGVNAENWANSQGGVTQKLLGTTGGAAGTLPDLIGSIGESSYIPSNGKCKRGFHMVTGVCWIDEFGSTAGKIKTPDVRRRMHKEYLERLAQGIDTNKVTVEIKDTTAQDIQLHQDKMTRAEFVDSETRKWIAAHPGAEYTMRPNAPIPPGGWAAFYQAKGEEWDRANGVAATGLGGAKEAHAAISAVTSVLNVFNPLKRGHGLKAGQDPVALNRHK